jgi:hypothetical protein
MVQWPIAGGGPGHIVEDSDRSGPAHVVAEEVGVLWMPAAPSACFALARGGSDSWWWQRPEVVVSAQARPEAARTGARR